MVTSLTTEAFLAALRRFIARRWKPQILYADNGTNFQGATNELHELAKMLQSTSQMSRIQDVRSGTHTIGEQSVPKLAEITGIGFLDLLYTLKQNIHEDSNVTCNN